MKINIKFFCLGLSGAPSRKRANARAQLDEQIKLIASSWIHFMYLLLGYTNHLNVYVFVLYTQLFLCILSFAVKPVGLVRRLVSSSEV